MTILKYPTIPVGVCHQSIIGSSIITKYAWDSKCRTASTHPKTKADGADDAGVRVPTCHGTASCLLNRLAKKTFAKKNNLKKKSVKETNAEKKSGEKKDAGTPNEEKKTAQKINAMKKNVEST